MLEIQNYFNIDSDKFEIHEAKIRIVIGNKTIDKNALLINNTLYINDRNDLYVTDKNRMICIEISTEAIFLDDSITIYNIKSAKYSNTYKKMQLLNADCLEDTKLITENRYLIHCIKNMLKQVIESNGATDKMTKEIDQLECTVFYNELFSFDKILRIQFD